MGRAGPLLLRAVLGHGGQRLQQGGLTLPRFHVHQKVRSVLMKEERDEQESVGPNRQYAKEIKVEAMRLAASIGGNAAAKRLGVPQSTVTNWGAQQEGLGPVVAAALLHRSIEEPWRRRFYAAAQRLASRWAAPARSASGGPGAGNVGPSG